MLHQYVHVFPSYVCLFIYEGKDKDYFIHYHMKKKVVQVSSIHLLNCGFSFCIFRPLIDYGLFLKYISYIFPMLTLGASYLCAGVSLKTQELYALVFACRYLDIFTYYVSLYNTIMKLIFLGSSFSIVWYMRYHKVVRRSYDKDQDTFRHYFLVLPCLLLALLINEKFTLKEVSKLYIVYSNYCATRNISFLTAFKSWLCNFCILFENTLMHWIGHVDIFPVFGSCCYTSSTSTFTEN